MNKLLKDESGQAMIMTVLAGGMLLLIMGMAVDVGVLFREKRRLQDAADAAATAAALDYHYNQSITTAKAAGQAAAVANGYTNDSVNCPSATKTCITINMPPSAGPSTAYSSFAEAIVQAPKATGIMGLSGIHSVDIYARAVAGNPAASKGCGYTQTLTLKGHYQVSGTAAGCGAPTTYPPACGIFVSSTSSSAVTVTGNGGCFDANFLDVAGGIGGNHDTKPTPTTSGLGEVQGDPFVAQLSSVPQPTSSSCAGSSAFTSATTVSATTSITVDSHGNLVPAGVGATSSKPYVCFTSAVTIGSGVTLPGLSTGSAIYIFTQGVTVPVGNSVSFGTGSYDSTTNTFTSTTGATMELYGGTLNQGSGQSLLSIFAPTTGGNGSTNGIAIWQPSSNTSTLQVQFGSNNETLDGFIYAPGADVTLHDNGGGVTATGFVSASMTLNSSSLTLPNYNSANPNTTPLTEIVMVE